MEITLQLRILLDVIIALVMGGVIGYERETKDKPAGFRTNMLISGASALLVSLGMYIANSMEMTLSDAALGVDPTRIIHAIIVGVSFIGAGTILKSSNEHTVKYLTTAATILFSSGAGMCVALHLYLLGAGVTILGLIVNMVMQKLYPEN